MRYDKNYLNKLRKQGVKPYKYIQNVERALIDETHSKEAWVEAALDNNPAQVFEVKEVKVMPMPERVLICLCFLLIIFNLGVLSLWL